jgi:hypothetical protein
MGGVTWAALEQLSPSSSQRKGLLTPCFLFRLKNQVNYYLYSIFKFTSLLKAFFIEDFVI